MKKIKRVSLFFKLLFLALLIVFPILFIWGWMVAPHSLSMLGGLVHMNMIPRAYSEYRVQTLTDMQKLLGLTLSLIPLAIEMIILYFLNRLFNLYHQGEIFTLRNVQYIRRIGYMLLIDQLIYPFYEFAMGIILTWHNPPGQRLAAISLDQANMGILLVALFMILISWIMVEGCKLREEQQLTI